MKMGVSAFIAKQGLKKNQDLPQLSIMVAAMKGKKGGKAEGGRASASDLIMKVSRTQWRATSAAVSQDAPPAARLLS